MQEVTFVLQSNIIGIILIAITLSSLTKSFKSGILVDKLFFILALSVMIVCFLEILGTVFNGSNFFGARELNRFFNALLFAANPVPVLLWVMYTHCKMYGNEEKLKKTYKFLMIPWIIVSALSFMNLFTDVFFTITPDNYYERAAFFPAATALSGVYIVVAVLIIFCRWKAVGKQLTIPLLSFMLLPALGLTLQFMFAGLYFLWVSSAVSIIIIFNHVQNDASITDWLTGLYNRKHLDNYLQQMCKRKRSNLIAGLMIDVDDFKSINDMYGHLKGDGALKSTASALKSASGNKAYVSRYAGDEFVVILQVNNEAEIISVIDRIHKELEEFNRSSADSYKLKVSIGYAVFKGTGEETEERFLSRMDSAMYEVKNNK